MLARERGFILPTTLACLLLFTSFVLFQLTQYTLEKELLNEEREVYRGEGLLQMGAIDALRLVKEDPRAAFTEKLFYEDGVVTITVNQIQTDVKFVQIVSQVKSQRTRQLHYYYYEANGTILPWLEE